MQNLSAVIEKLKERKGGLRKEYFVPEVWNAFGYKYFDKSPEREKEIRVDPYDFFIYCIQYIILSRETPGGIIKGKPEKEIKDHCDIVDDLKKSVIYSILPRMFTAWGHSKDKTLESGTFLKTICLLPYLKSMGVNIIYLLPVFEYSGRYKKGEIGSPYAIKNIYKLDENLHDSLLGEYDEDLLKIQFRAFVEACHMMGIKVMADFVFRTVSRDSDLIEEHPDWFYWINTRYNDAFKVPKLKELEKQSSLNDELTEKLYKSENIDEYLKIFSFDPKTLDPAKWEEIIKIRRSTKKGLLELIEEHFGITTVPGFSDVVNDSQPPWSDVTFLKFYSDVLPHAKDYVKEQQPPYILHDGVKMNLYQGNEKKQELFDYIEGIIPYYQHNFKIDGARIDMGHALPDVLNESIVRRAREINPHFILWSEEFNPKNSGEVKRQGFHFISGGLWSIYKDLEKDNFNFQILEQLSALQIPLAAGPETPDTARITGILTDRDMIECVIWISFLVPDGIPFINNGLEILEKQPMNLGLDDTGAGRFVLSKDDEMYGKLAFFDNYCLHWVNNGYEWMLKLIKNAGAIRAEYSSLIAKAGNFKSEFMDLFEGKTTFLLFNDIKTGENLFFLASREYKKAITVKFDYFCSEENENRYRKVKIIYSNKNRSQDRTIPGQAWNLGPGEIIIGSII